MVFGTREIGYHLLAKTGSLVVRNIRVEQDRSKMKDRFWEVAGTKLGDVLGVSSERKEIEETTSKG